MTKLAVFRPDGFLSDRLLGPFALCAKGMVVSAPCAAGTAACKTRRCEILSHLQKISIMKMSRYVASFWIALQSSGCECDKVATDPSRWRDTFALYSMV